MTEPASSSVWLPGASANVTVQTVSSTTLNATLAHDIAQRLTAAIQARGFAVLSVSGGKSPIAMFEALRESPIDWPQVRITLVDERCVPCNHPDSNALMVQTHLLHGRARHAQWVPMIKDAAEPLATPTVLAQAANMALQAAGSTDVLVLGMGADGHIASLFPDATNLTEAMDLQNTRACMAIELPHPPANAPYQRLSQTLARLLAAGHIVLPLLGAVKLDTLKQAWRRPGNRYPVSRVLHQTQTPIALWIVS